MPTTFTIIRSILIAAASAACPATMPVIADEIPLSSLDLAKMRQDWGEPQVDQSITGRPLSIGGHIFERGVGSHASSSLRLELDGKAERFTAWVGVDDGAEGRGSLTFLIYGDGRKLFDSGVMKGGDAAKRVDVPLTNVKHLILATTAGADIHYDHANWAEATFLMSAGARPRGVEVPREEPFLLTPKPGPAPKINGPALCGARPGKPFLYRIPCTGRRPIGFSAERLPASLTLDSQRGIIEGLAPRERGEHVITLCAENEHGADAREFKLVVGDSLALTPPMGWNSWYIHYDRVTEADMRAAADAMIESGMADFGYQYVNIDDCWMKRKGDEPYRDVDGAVLPNAKFPDMRGLADHIHSLGLRAGLYTSPGPWTCAGYVGAYEHEEADARRFAAWGYDFLKYDWCHYESVASGEGVERLQHPYRKIAGILETLDRDMVLNICQYGMGEVWKWGAEVGGHCWRTTDDLGNVRGGLLPGFYAIGLSNARHWEYARPGAWNDPDYILIGWIDSPFVSGEGAPVTLTPNEQYSYMSMWCLMAAPLFFSGDMTKLDEFTLNVLCNAEVIAVDQDPLGKQARVCRQTDEEFILAKPLADGALAVGMFNLTEYEREIGVAWGELGFAGEQTVRDLWRQNDLGAVADKFEARVARHGVALLRLQPAR